MGYIQTDIYIYIGSVSQQYVFGTDKHNEQAWSLWVFADVFNIITWSRQICNGRQLESNSALISWLLNNSWGAADREKAASSLAFRMCCCWSQKPRPPFLLIAHCSPLTPTLHCHSFSGQTEIFINTNWTFREGEYSFILLRILQNCMGGGLILCCLLADDIAHIASSASEQIDVLCAWLCAVCWGSLAAQPEHTHAMYCSNVNTAWGPAALKMNSSGEKKRDTEINTLDNLFKV